MSSTYKKIISKTDYVAPQDWVQIKTIDIHPEGKAPAVFICETLLGVGRQIPLSKNYLNTVYDYVKKAGGVRIA